MTFIKDKPRILIIIYGLIIILGVVISIILVNSQNNQREDSEMVYTDYFDSYGGVIKASINPYTGYYDTQNGPSYIMKNGEWVTVDMN